MGWMTKKNTTAATSTNEMATFKKSPYMNLLPLIVNDKLEKSGWPPTAAIRGVTKSFTNALMTPVNAAPITTATAKSTTLPRRINFLKSFSIPYSIQLFKLRAMAAQKDDADRSLLAAPLLWR